MTPRRCSARATHWPVHRRATPAATCAATCPAASEGAASSGAPQPIADRVLRVLPTFPRNPEVGA